MAAALSSHGGNFLQGAQPSAADAAAFARLAADVAAGKLARAALPPALARWFDLVGLFADATRAAWA